MPESKIKQINHLVALGGGHGLGRVMSSLNFLGDKLTGIVTTTDNGGSTGRIRNAQGGIAWGDLRNCLNQLITQPSTASRMFEYRFSGQGELSGHNLGNLMLKALDNLSIRPLEAINLIRDLLKIESNLIPMSEEPVDLLAYDASNTPIYGEVNIDALEEMPRHLQLTHQAKVTQEAVHAINQADLILVGPGSFFTSLMPLFLVKDLVNALHESRGKICYIGNLGPEVSKAAASLSLFDKLAVLESKMHGRSIDSVIISDWGNMPSRMDGKIVIKTSLCEDEQMYLHDRIKLKKAISLLVEKIL
ncbi:gluconeogenesis factor YvcK family protein [Thorsellia kenyensis]|uniref:Putative gluconeogenesis factor n=1 Tax=Thorsellia kenyensis TaxID=1549888 RepID=A0ABV6CA14_9GAMM